MSTAVETGAEIRPFHVDFPQDEIDDRGAQITDVMGAEAPPERSWGRRAANELRAAFRSLRSQ